MPSDDLYRALLAKARKYADHGDTPAEGVLGAVVEAVVELHVPASAQMLDAISKAVSIIMPSRQRIAS